MGIWHPEHVSKPSVTKKTELHLMAQSDGTREPRRYHRTELGQVYLGDALRTLDKHVKPKSVDLIVTSPPFGLVRKKEYGNVPADEYVEWFKPFGEMFQQMLRATGSLVIDIGGAWIPGQPTRSLYHYELLIMLCRECGFHLAQELFWWNPSKLPTPAEWVTVRRIRVKDAINCVWWLSPTPWPKASNRRVGFESMQGLSQYDHPVLCCPTRCRIADHFPADSGADLRRAG